MGKRLQKVLMALLFLLGLAVFSYPFARRFLVRQEMNSTVREFQEQKPTIPIHTQGQSVEEELPYAELWEEMCAYNDNLYVQKQADLNGTDDFRESSFHLQDYGRKDEVFAVLTIPRIDLEMPVFLGARDDNLASGAAHLSQTSLPIGGENTNCVIAGHRGYGGASYFRYIDKLKIGDTVTITNLWEQLTYRVAEIKIIYPYEVDEILIQEGRELLTLLTCHPYASGGKQRYLVICERVYQEDNYG